MVINKKLLNNILIGILVLILLYLIVKLFPVYKVVLLFLVKLLTPFVIAAFISYLLYPVIQKLQQANINKTLAILIIYFCFFSLIGLMIYFGIPIFVNQLHDLSEQLPQMIIAGETMIFSLYEYTSFLPEIVHDKMDVTFMQMEKNLGTSIESILEKLTNVFDFVIILTVIPVLVFYFLKDYDKIKEYIRKLIRKEHHTRMSVLIYAVDKSLGNYIRGQFFLALCIILVSFIVYHLLQLKYALLLAIFMGLFNLIPYFGPIIGIIPAAIIAASVSWKHVIIVLVSALAIQILESSFLSPYIMGKSVQIHPIVIILALLIGAEIGHIIGMVLAVPLMTIIREITIQFMALKRLEN